MKKSLLLFSLVILSAGVLTAQSLKVLSVHTTTDGYGNKASGMHIKNMTANQLIVKAKRTGNDLANEHTRNFC